MADTLQTARTDDTLSDVPLNIDDQGFPILEEVVESGSGRLETSLQAGLGLPQHEPLLRAMRQQLKGEISDQLTPLIEQVVTSAIDQVTDHLEAAMREELNGRLHRRIDEMVEEAIDQHLPLNPTAPANR